ncbi:hypothetical protein METHPM2_180010 [Pseudomonas sp. PM2]
MESCRKRAASSELRVLDTFEGANDSQIDPICLWLRLRFMTGARGHFLAGLTRLKRETEHYGKVNIQDGTYRLRHCCYGNCPA